MPEDQVKYGERWSLYHPHGWEIVRQTFDNFGIMTEDIIFSGTTDNLYDAMNERAAYLNTHPDVWQAIFNNKVIEAIAADLEKTIEWRKPVIKVSDPTLSVGIVYLDKYGRKCYPTIPPDVTYTRKLVTYHPGFDEPKQITREFGYKSMLHPWYIRLWIWFRYYFL